MESIEEYEAGVRPAREAFASAPAVRRTVGADSSAELLEGFLIYYSALGVAMTEPVEGWIARAGERTAQVGPVDLGRALQGHAKAESGHHLLMIDDLRGLCARWNASGRPTMDPDELLATPWTDAVHRYRTLHEDVIVGDTPYAQIAIENEIEMLAVTWAPDVLANARRLCGGQIMDALSFLAEHVELDVGHTKFNRRQMAKFLDGRPEAVQPLIAAGTAALESYRDFVTDCVTLADSALALAR